MARKLSFSLDSQIIADTWPQPPVMKNWMNLIIDPDSLHEKVADFLGRTSDENGRTAFHFVFGKDMKGAESWIHLMHYLPMLQSFLSSAGIEWQVSITAHTTAGTDSTLRVIYLDEHKDESHVVSSASMAMLNTGQMLTLLDKNPNLRGAFRLLGFIAVIPYLFPTMPIKPPFCGTPALFFVMCKMMRIELRSL